MLILWGEEEEQKSPRILGIRPFLAHETHPTSKSTQRSMLYFMEQEIWKKWPSQIYCLRLRIFLKGYVCPSVHSSIYLSIHLSIYPSVCPSVHLSVHPSSIHGVWVRVGGVWRPTGVVCGPIRGVWGPARGTDWPIHYKKPLKSAYKE